jgi:dolichol-phosphate mannosyltransferase
MTGEQDGTGVSIIIPAYREGENIVPVLTRILRGVETTCEVLVVVDFPEDPTVAVVDDFQGSESNVKHLVNT